MNSAARRVAMEPQQSSVALRSHVSRRPWGRLSALDAREQLKEVGVLLSLILVRMQMLNYVDAFISSKSERMHVVKQALIYTSAHIKELVFYVDLAMIASLVLCVALGRRIPRRWLDVIAGSFIAFNLIVHFIKINLLLLTPPADPSMLLGQILAYLIFFVLAWGWIFWRFDWVGKGAPGAVVELADNGNSLSMFDYYHASLMSLVRRGKPEILGLNRTGKVLVATHTIMVLDLIGLALGRFYQLITKMI
jgi:hypothetical protein